MSEMASAYKSIKSSENENEESRERRRSDVVAGHLRWGLFWLNEMETDAATAHAGDAAAHLSK